MQELMRWVDYDIPLPWIGLGGFEMGWREGGCCEICRYGVGGAGIVLAGARPQSSFGQSKQMADRVGDKALSPATR